MGYYSSFVVKVWVDNDQNMSRGYIQHVGTQETMHFLGFDKMLEFIDGHLNPPPNHWVGPEEGTGLSKVAQDREMPDE
jgi:hypothetical protein